jgi:hypothetical protein
LLDLRYTIEFVPFEIKSRGSKCLWIVDESIFQVLPRETQMMSGEE